MSCVAAVAMKSSFGFRISDGHELSSYHTNFNVTCRHVATRQSAFFLRCRPSMRRWAFNRVRLTEGDEHEHGTE